MKRIILTVALLSLIPWTVKAQTMTLEYKYTDSTDIPTLRYSTDNWFGRDKAEHFAVAGAGMVLTSALWSRTNTWQVAGVNTVLWGLWEVKDAIIPWERYGWWGGDGFSHKDLAWSAGGITVATLLVLVIK